MTEPINLTELRDQIANQANDLNVDYYPIEHDTLLALIDVAEAARELVNTQPNMTRHSAFDRIHNALARFTTQDKPT